MTASINPAAPHHLPIFITAPGSTDVLMIITGVLLLAAVVGFGVLFFWLHSLPERIAHKGDKLQMEIVAVLCLISLFTHIHLFWIVGLLLALIDIPNFGGWMGRIARSTETIAGITAPEETPRPVESPHVAAQAAPEPAPHAAPKEAVHA